MNKEELKQLIREILQEQNESGVKLRKLPQIAVSPGDKLDTGNPDHQVYTHDIFTLEESPRLGAGIREMRATEFPWHLGYDEIDYVIEGELTVKCGETAVTAKAGEVILIPKGSDIFFSVPTQARFLYVTYPADWQKQ